MDKRKRSVMLICSVVAVVILFVGAFFLKSYSSEKQAQAMLKEHYDARVAYFTKDNQRYNDMDVDVAFIGDSLIEGYEVTKFYPQYVTSNRGINGDTTVTLQNRLKVSLYDLQPKVCVMLVGFNNYDEMFDNYEQILMDMKTNLPATKVVLMSLLPTNGEFAQANETLISNNVQIKQLATKYNYTYVDAYTPLLDTRTNQLTENFTYDGVHLTEKGYKVVTDTLTPVLKKIFDSERFI